MQIVNRLEYNKAKQTFYRNVAAMKNEEVFGMKSNGVKWACLFKDFIIITFLNGLNDSDYGMEEVSCLTNKITK